MDHLIFAAIVIVASILFVWYCKCHTIEKMFNKKFYDPNTPEGRCRILEREIDKILDARALAQKEKDLKLKLQVEQFIESIGTIEPTWDEETTSWEYTHPAYPDVEVYGKTKEWVKTYYSLILLDYLRDKQDNA